MPAYVPTIPPPIADPSPSPIPSPPPPVPTPGRGGFVQALIGLGLSLGVLVWLATRFGPITVVTVRVELPLSASAAVSPSPSPVPAERIATPKPTGLHVAMLYDSTTISPERAAAFDDAVLKAYLDAHCAPDGSRRDWAVWDVRHPTPPDSATLRDALAKPRSFLPWMVVTGGATDFAGPMPPTAAETVALLKRLGE